MAKGRKTKLPVFIITFLLVFIAGGVFLCLLLMRPERKLSGSWVTKKSIENDAHSAAKQWLDSARLGNEVNLEGIDDISVSLTLELYKRHLEDVYRRSRIHLPL